MADFYNFQTGTVLSTISITKNLIPTKNHAKYNFLQPHLTLINFDLFNPNFAKFCSLQVEIQNVLSENATKFSNCLGIYTKARYF